MLNNSRLQPLQPCEAFRSALLHPGIAAIVLGIAFATLMLLFGALAGSLPGSEQPQNFFGYRVTVKVMANLAAILMLILPPMLFIPPTYFDMKKRFVRCLECRRLRSMAEIKRLNAIKRCPGCEHELT